MLYGLLIIICSLSVVLLMLKKKSDLEPPELSGRLPIVGHGHKIMGNAVKLRDAILRFSIECLEKGGVATIQLGPLNKVYCVADPQDALAITSTCFERHYYWDYPKPILGNGLLTADAQTWKKHRRLLTPAFGQQVLDSFIDIFNAQSQKLVEKFASKLGKELNHVYILRVYALETTCATACGENTSEFSVFYDQYLNLVDKWLEAINIRFQTIWMHYDFIYNYSTDKIELNKELEQYMALAKSILETMRMKKASPDTGISDDKPKSFIELLLDLVNDFSLTEEEAREETDTLLVAAHETTASTITFAMTMLGSYKHIQEKAYEEVVNVCGVDGAVSKEELSKLVYIEAILKETLRVHEIVIVLARYIDKDVKLKNYTIKANSNCFILTHGLNHHSMWGPDADKFRPERWLEKETLPDPKYFSAFGLGRRYCIGKAYAMMSMKIALAYVVRAYRISSDASKMRIAHHSMSRPESGHFVTLEQRDNFD